MLLLRCATGNACKTVSRVSVSVRLIACGRIPWSAAETAESDSFNAATPYVLIVNDQTKVKFLKSGIARNV